MWGAKRFLLVVGLFFLSGCGGLVDWAHETFDQGKLHKKDRELVARDLKSVRIYDGFATVGMFDVLWLSDDIRALYTDTFSARHGKSKEVRETFLRRQSKANSQHTYLFHLG